MTQFYHYALFSALSVNISLQPNILLANFHKIPSSRIFIHPSILLPIMLKIKYYSKKESYLTQWPTKAFQNIKLVSLYSKSVSCENSKCLHFVSVQIKNIVRNRKIFPLLQTELKNESYFTQWHTNGFQNIKLVSLYSKSVSYENSKSLYFVSVQEKT